MTFPAPTPDPLGLDDNWPRLGSVVLDAARSQEFSGELELDTFPRLRVYLDRGEIYLAERVSDPPIGVRLVEAGALTAAELAQGAIRIGDTEHLGRLFDRAPSVDRHAVMVTLELMNDEAISWAANQLVRGVTVTGYRRHVSAVHRWHRDPLRAPGASVAQPLPPPPPDAVPSPGPPSWLPLGDVEQLDDEVRIEWAESSWLGERPDVVPRPVVVPPAPPIVTVEARVEVPLPVADVVPGREVGDAFELIWPTGEIDEQFLGGPLSEVPPPSAPLTAAPLAPATPPGLAVTPALETMTVLLRPLTPASESDAPGVGPVSDDVVLAIQRAIAAIASDPAAVWEPTEDAPHGQWRGTTAVVEELATRPRTGAARSTGDAPGVDEPAPVPLLPAPTTGSALAAPGSSDPTAASGDPDAIDSPAEPSDERRSALKRLISGLRRH